MLLVQAAAVVAEDHKDLDVTVVAVQVVQVRLVAADLEVLQVQPVLLEVVMDVTGMGVMQMNVMDSEVGPAEWVEMVRGIQLEIDRALTLLRGHIFFPTDKVQAVILVWVAAAAAAVAAVP
jgi:hypothetical protein